ncbi:DNA-3-methyladenine glycosylase I [Parvularcula sp. LCG005]|uniref:DNA-3-methyladenine glycosylase I n=1 Tax=Parvularcula sp. LCG005 TaxID=3078805 RepID=UPI002943E3CC|nr:DNA-3-methyladenine glycosylase I [Parvularcula sp. LCG005]WOI52777.1 DNA-3-methyladenine glycosylase I [Parvularcula sp. LCG005]
MLRCPWAPDDDPLYAAYHDTDWGVPERDSRALYEKLILDGFQAGLSWRTILYKRENFRAAFEGFDPVRIAQWGEKDVTRLLGDAGIVRHRGKIEGAITNARAWCDMADAGQDFSAHLWSFVDGSPLQNNWTTTAEVPATSPEGNALSKDLKARGFKFCGPTIVYAFMQAVGMVNDHLTACPRHADCRAMASQR